MNSLKNSIKDLQFYELIGKPSCFRTIGYTHNNEVIAYADIEIINKKDAHLLFILVEEAWRRLGLAKRLISILKNRYVSIYGYSLLESISFYEHLGFNFKRTGVNNQFYWNKPQNGVETVKANRFNGDFQK